MSVGNFIKPDVLTLDELLKGRLFEVPDFQRPYSWKKEQREDLFSDLDLLIKEKKNTHFMATIVCLDVKKEHIGTDEFQKVQIVDGQQRLTTLIILLKVIQLTLKKNESKNKREIENLQKLFVRGKKLVLLQTNHQSQEMFRKFLVSGIIPDPDVQTTMAEKEIANAIKESQSYVNNKIDDGSLINLLKTLKNRIHFIFYTIKDEKVVYTVFELLNSRGLPVASLDKCKSMLMGIVYEKYNKAESKEIIKSLHSIWNSIYSEIGTQKISDSELLRFAATLCYFKSYSSSAESYGTQSLGKPLSEDESLKYLEYIAKASSRSVDLPDTLKDENEDICVLISRVIKEVTIKLSSFGKDVRKNNGVTNIIQARLLAVSIELSNYTESQKKELNDLWDKITFRIYGLYDKDSRNCVGDYVRLAREIYYGQDYDTSYEALKRIGKDYPIEPVINEIRGRSWYDKYNDALKYVLYRYEEHLAKTIGAKISDNVWSQIWSDTPSKTIEHIYPKTFNDDLKKNWPDASINCQKDLDEFVHNIGNLTLLPPGLNSKLGQKSFNEKKDEYRRHSLRITDDVVKRRKWNKNAVLAREKEILDFIQKAWE